MRRGGAYDGKRKTRIDRLQNGKAFETAQSQSGIVLDCADHDSVDGGISDLFARQVHFRVGGNAGNVPQSDTDVRACHRLLKHSRVFQRKLKVRIPDFIAVIVYLFIFIHFILGEIYRFYDHYILFDKILHTTGGAIIAFIGFSVVLSFTNLESKKVKLSPFFIVVFSFCFALSIEYIWELVEYAVDSVSYEIAGFAGASNMQRWKDGIVSMNPDGTYVTDAVRGSGLKDSMMDMLVNIIGAAVVCGIALVGLKLRPDWFEGKRLMSYKKIPEYVRENVEEMTEEEFSAAYARMFCEKKKRPIVSLEKFEKKKRK